MTIVLPERIISADDHMDVNVLPTDLFAARLPKQLRDSVPQVVDTPEGPMWSIGAARLGPSGRRSKGLITHEELAARQALLRAAHKLPVATRFVRRRHKI